MKKLLLLVLIASLTTCNDGDVIVTTFNFNSVNLQSCGSSGGYLFFKINDGGSESISLRLGTSAELFMVSDTLVSTLDGSSNFVNYRVFDGAVSSDYFCNQVPPTQPVVTIEYVAQSGTSTLITTTERDDADGLSREQEGSGDPDGDGLANFFDFDDDGDNVPTILELDTENLDGDNDPLTNPLDTDGDKIPDYLDTDDDGDGVLTRYEADGTLDPTTIITDPGEGPDYLNSVIANEVIIDEFREHNYNFDSDIDLVLSNLILINGEEQITRETLDMGMIESILTGNILVTPAFPSN
ncbi:MAG: hypothetical protein HKO54_02715 [Flavobacteriaceae bacterium]|nr:hypothetical protein [Flavobacteriaceae bacterium]